MDDFDKLGQPIKVKESRQQTTLFEEMEPRQAARIRDGNIKLWERWILIRGMKEGTGKDGFLKSWDEAKDRLLKLCQELVDMEYRKCLYEKEKPKYACLACPVEKIQPDKCPVWGIDI